MEYSITKEDFKKFEEYFTFHAIKSPTYRYGQAFLNYFSPDAEAYLRQKSNLGIGRGVHSPSDDSILWEIKSAKEAELFIKERIEIV
jgi:hypothetical protein